MGKFIDLSGKIFGKLKVLKRTEDKIQPNGRKVAMWLCQCQCVEKTLITVSTDRLNSGVTKSCGCLRKETVSKLSKKYNKYDLSGDYGIGWTSNTNEEFYFDLDDYDKIKNYCWHKNNNGYIQYIKNNGHFYGENIIISRLIMNAPNDLVVDHINHNLLDNRKSNLRLATISQNAMNSKPRNNCSSKSTGVWKDSNNKWCAALTIDDNFIWLGRFEKEEDAIDIRIEAENKYFKEFSYINSIANSSLKFTL